MGDPVRRRASPHRFGAFLEVVALSFGGLGGAGTFVGLAPAAAFAGPWFLLSIPIAAIAAGCCAWVATALGRPESAYARVRDSLGILPARIAGSLDLVGWVAIVAASAAAIGDYLAPEFATGVASVAVLLSVLASTAGSRIRGTALWLWFALTVAVVGLVVAVCFTISPPALFPMPWTAGGFRASHGLAAAAATMFVLFLGFERVTTPVADRDRYPPQLVRLGLGVSLVSIVGLASLVGAGEAVQLGWSRLALSPTPVLDALGAADAASMAPLVALLVALVMIPVLLAALESFGATAVAMVRVGDLPSALGRTGGNGTPYLLELIVGVAAWVAVSLVESAQAVVFAACCLLVRYAFTHAAAWLSLDVGQSRLRWVACFGAGLSVLLAISMPLPVLLAVLATVVVGPAMLALIASHER